ncbi:FtsX-like permease family protein [Streptomyces sp. NBC_01092]|uniref:FtsX-like permease family protein n=1 Tax=Streptomyces sp. NBC_01092 TaxID=2903748 RepID=UPI00386C2B18|nr:ABC transporter permease [Streptomyces sp. NBC_01092]
MRADVRLAWLLTRGSDRREWWRITLTAIGAAFATGIGLTVAAVASMRGQYSVSVGAGLLDHASDRQGVIITLLLLLVPVLGFLGQCARVGAVHRDRRLAALRLAGATPRQVRRIAALEAGPACLVGSAVATVFSVLLLLRVWQHPEPLAWLGIALVAVAVPVLGTVVSALSLRRVVASPLGWVRRVRPTRGPGRAFLAVTGLLAVTTLSLGLTTMFGNPLEFAFGPLAVFTLCLLTGASAVWLAGWSSRRLGTALAARAQRPALLIAAERLRDDPWAAARTHAAVLLVTVVGTAFVGIRAVLLHVVAHTEYLAENRSYYTTGLDLSGAAILVALALTLSALAVGTAESLATRRRGLAAQAAAGVPQRVLGRALLLETALPLAPALLLAGAGGTAIYMGWATMIDDAAGPLPLVPMLVPVAVYAVCLLAAATSLPLLRRSVRPAELRYA